MIFCYTKLRSHRKKTDIGFKITNKKIRLLLNIRFPAGKCIGRRPSILLCKQSWIQWLVIYSRVFFEISIFTTTNNL